MQWSCFILLKQAVYYLSTDVFLVGLEQFCGEEQLCTSDDLVLRFVEMIAQARSQVYPRP